MSSLKLSNYLIIRFLWNGQPVIWYVHQNWGYVIGAGIGIIIGIPICVIALQYQKQKKRLERRRVRFIPLNGGELSPIDCFDPSETEKEVSELYISEDVMVNALINYALERKPLKNFPKMVDFKTFLSWLAMLESKKFFELF